MVCSKIKACGVELAPTVIVLELLPHPANASTGKHDVDDQAHGDEWGVFYSSFSPIYNSAGKVVGIIGVDFTKEWLDSQLSRISWVIVIGLVISLVVGVVIVDISLSGVRKKFKSVNNELANLSGGIDELNEIINLDENRAPVDTKDNIKHGESSDVVTTDELSSINVKVRSMHDSHEKELYSKREMKPAGPPI